LEDDGHGAMFFFLEASLLKNIFCNEGVVLVVILDLLRVVGHCGGVSLFLLRASLIC
jgi:hypothetical protein